MKKSKNKRKVLIVLLLIVAVVGVFINKTKGQDQESSLRNDILSGEYNFGNSELLLYSEFLAAYSDGDYRSQDIEQITVKGTEYASIEMDGNQPKEDYLLTTGKGSVTYEVNVPKAGLYNIVVEYCTTTDSTLNIVRDLYVNGKIPFQEAKGIIFERSWNDDDKSFLMNTNGNQTAPNEIQSAEFVKRKITSAEYNVGGDCAFYLNEGVNTITLSSDQGDMGIRNISVVGANKSLPYAEYYNQCIAQGAQIIDKNQGEMIFVQGEDTFNKTASSLVPQNNRTSSRTQPYHPSNIVYNTIGGESWSTTGEGITWNVNVPEAGLYKIGLRVRQSLNRGFYSIRELRVNQEVPFAEASGLQFNYDADFQTLYLGTETEPYYFYFNKGDNTITMTATLASLTEAVEKVGKSVSNLNSLYRKITAVTGTNPDLYRDYDILSSVPDMVDVMKTEYARLDQVIGMFGESLEGGIKTSDISQMMTVLEKLIRDPNKIAKFIGDYNDKVSALSDWMLSLGTQPLEIDYLCVSPDGYEMEKAEGGFFETATHTVKSFIGSFTNDYKVGSSNGKEDKVLNVWISTSTRSEYEAVQDMVNNYFESTDYKVNLSMVKADALLPSAAAGEGPDVAVELNYSIPTNFAFRNAAYDLSQFPDFEEVASRFAPGTMEYMEYNGGYYGLPDGMTYPVMFYRKDILDELGLEIPETWDELKAIIPYLEADNMSIFMNTTGNINLGGGSSTVTIPVNSIFASMLYQNGLELYNESQTKAVLGTNENLQIFKEWTEYYTKQGLEYSISLLTRFRTGEVPLIIDDYTYRNQLMVSAPEIAGQWGIAQVPGTVKADGTIDHTTVCNVSSGIILKKTVEKSGMANEAWDFLKWWTSKEAQEQYNSKLKAKDGAGSEYPMANLEALESLSMDKASKETVKNTYACLRGFPQIPGGYVTGRTVRNSFLSVINNNQDPVDTLYMNVDDIDSEIAKMREAFGLNK